MFKAQILQLAECTGTVEVVYRREGKMLLVDYVRTEPRLLAIGVVFIQQDLCKVKGLCGAVVLEFQVEIVCAIPVLSGDQNQIVSRLGRGREQGIAFTLQI